MKKSVLASFLCLVFIFSAVSCTKKDPNPELSDQIYQDIKSEIDIAQKNFDAEIVQNKKVVEESKSVVPQTGQIKMASKRVYESDSNLTLYRQQLKYFQIKLEQRKSYVVDRYSESFRKEGRPWPDPDELKEYKIRMKLQKSALTWGKNSSEPAPNKKDVPRGTDAGGPGSAPAPASH